MITCCIYFEATVFAVTRLAPATGGAKKNFLLLIQGAEKLAVKTASCGSVCLVGEQTGISERKRAMKRRRRCFVEKNPREVFASNDVTYCRSSCREIRALREFSLANGRLNLALEKERPSEPLHIPASPGSYTERSKTYRCIE